MRFLLESRLVSNCLLPNGVSNVQIVDSSGNIKFRLSNDQVRQGTGRSTMICLFVFEAEGFEPASTLGVRELGKFLDALAFATCLKFQLERPLRLIDWSDGNFDREFDVFATEPGHEFPIQALTQPILETAQEIRESTVGTYLEQAIEWFSSGVAASRARDKYQLFFYALETIVSKDDLPEKNDVCQKCGSSLYCETCETYPSHKPFPRQKIDTILFQYLELKDDARRARIFKLRNMLAHGDNLEVIESRLGCEIGDVLEDLAGVVRDQILVRVMGLSANSGQTDRLSLLHLEGYAHLLFEARARVTSSAIPPDPDMLDRLAFPTVNLISPKPE
ncbi:hypothetical protein [uncultured Maricaulis sp.]|uniref:hypothetical protein n=1 Tax=uncultured Maricaulis sp. TaxID=174710 RepID=UPI0030D9A21E